MNSEELELSLRTEFEEQLKSVFADMRQEMTQLQEKVEAEFEKHKSQMGDIFRDFSSRAETEKSLDSGFTDSVVEHLRLARDEGARITATAIAEAEEMQRAAAEEKAAEPTVGISDLRDAIKDISSQTSQSSILKTLVEHAAKFTTRGAFFILKNEHFVGWRTFGSKQDESDDQTIREIFFPATAETVLGESVKSLSAVESTFGTYSGDAAYLDKLQFGQPEKMFAVPLIARGRGVAVLYADGGEENAEVNVEALETLVRVAGLTVEVTASAPPPAAPAKFEAAATQSYASPSSFVQAPQKAEEAAPQNDYQVEEKATEPSAFESYQTESPVAEDQTAMNYDQSFDANSTDSAAQTDYYSPSENFSYQTNPSTEIKDQDFDSDAYSVEVIDDESEAATQDLQHLDSTQDAQSVYGQAEATSNNYSWNENAEDYSGSGNEEVESYQNTYQTTPTENFSAPPTREYQFDTNQYQNDQYSETPSVQFEENNAFESSQFDAGEQFAAPTETASFAGNESYDSFKADNKTEDFASSTTAQTYNAPTPTTPTARSRFSDRNVDLPIEVSEDERRLHNDARRFARLLVSEIKLYNEQKVKEGREEHDLYDRLREAIDRSREMYDKRVQPPVAAKFDYFHYELVNTLAEGEAAKLGAGYQGASV